LPNHAERTPTAFAQAEAAARRRLVEQLDQHADQRDAWKARNAAYYEAINRLARFVVPAGAQVLEIGCGTGDLLAALEPRQGVGLDISPRTIELARRKYPGLEWIVDDAEQLDHPALRGRTFDYVVLSDVVGMLKDVWAAFRAVRRVCHPKTRIFISYYNFVWEPLLAAGERLGRKMPIAQQNWLGMQDLENLLELNHLQVIRKGTAQLLPLEVPLLQPLANRWLAQAPLLRHFALTQYFVCRLAGGGGPVPHQRDYSCSVIVPCKDERGNIDDIVARVPGMGKWTEIIFVDGSSRDGTVDAIERHLAAGTRPRLRLLHQGDGRGKGDAVRKGFAAAEGDVLFILDADLTVAPEDLPKFYAALAEGCAEFVNGSRLVYPMEEEAMRFLNSLGNKAFGLALSSVLGQRLKDTLCGTKVLFRQDYEKIAGGRAFFGDFDPFGDFDLLFGAAKQNLKIVELPVRYRARTYGDTKISRFRHGAMLAGMTGVAWRKFKSAF
jgi:SAM-dependent methyltransferase